MKVVNLPIEKLIPYDKNPRKNDKAVEAVAASIREFGFKNPIVLTKDSVVINGHTRLKAAKKLGMKEVPCIIADDLTDEQARAFRLADNKVGEIAGWDFDLLDAEIEELPEFNFEEFGFEFEEEVATERWDTDSHIYGNTKFMEYDETRAEGKYGMPMLEPVDHVPKRMVGFKYIKEEKDKDSCVHFYLHDYQFEIMWSQPYRYIPLLRQFDSCLTPNFSIYLDMPEAIKIWNTYRARLIGQILQDNGLTVIPMVYWSDERSYEYCFDGIPENSTISTNNIGNSVPEARKLWHAGMRELIKRKHPKRILLYGNDMKEDFDFGDVEVIYYKNEFLEERRENERQRRLQEKADNDKMKEGK